MTYDAIREKLATGRSVILDGAIGTEILRREVTWADHQLLRRPDLVRSIHADYIAAGADVLSTNTFQLSRRGFAQHFKDADHMRRVGAPDLTTRWKDLIHAGVRLAHEARAAAGVTERVALAGAMTTLEWCFRPDLAPDRRLAEAEYRELMNAFADAGCDLLLIETVNSVADAVAAGRAARDVGLPYWMAFVPDEHGKLFSGETLDEAARALEALKPDAILVNCAPPNDIDAGLDELLRAWRGPSGAYPHIGRFDPPEWLFTDEFPPERYVERARTWRQRGAAVVGGCCGTTPAHIAALAAQLT